VASGIGSARPTGGGGMPSTCTACRPETPAITTSATARPQTTNASVCRGSAEPERDDVRTRPTASQPPQPLGNAHSLDSNTRATHCECVGSKFEASAARPWSDGAPTGLRTAGKIERGTTRGTKWCPDLHILVVSSVRTTHASSGCERQRRRVPAPHFDLTLRAALSAAGRCPSVPGCVPAASPSLSARRAGAVPVVRARRRPLTILPPRRLELRCGSLPARCPRRGDLVFRFCDRASQVGDVVPLVLKPLAQLAGAL
jgi:hypothetical protein